MKNDVCFHTNDAHDTLKAMLNPFPIQFLSILAYAILRVGVGLLLIHLGVKHIRVRDELKSQITFSFFPFGSFIVWYMAFFEIIIGVMFFLGLYTQIAALLTMVFSIKFILLRRKFVSPSIPSRYFYALLLFASLSLFITGAGAFAFDLPI